MESLNTNPVAKLSKSLLKLNAYEFNLVAMLLGYIIADDLDAYEQSAMGNFFESLGQVLETVGAQNQYLDRLNEKDNNKEIIDKLLKLTQKIDNIEIIINKFKDL